MDLISDTPSKDDLLEIQGYLVDLEALFSELATLDLKIALEIDKTDEEAADKETDDACKLQMKNRLKITQAKNFLSVHGGTSDKKPVVTPVKPAITSKLPKLNLPNFDGTLTDWLPFWERFSVEVDQRSDLSEITKFDYLYGLLQKDALNAVKSLIPSSANYKVLKDTLLDNFGKTRKIVRAHVLRLLQLPKPELSGLGLRKFYNQIMTDLRSLSALKIDVNNSAAVLVPILEEKLPPRVKGNMAELDTSDNFSLDTFLTCLKKQVERYEQECYTLDLNASHPKPVMETTYGSQEETTPTATVGSFAGITTQCALCGSSSHATLGCKLSWKQKKDLVMAKKLCVNCLKPGHFYRSCEERKHCTKCNGLHHTAVHGITFGRRSAGQGQNRRRSRQNSQEPQDNNASSGNQTPTTQASCSIVHTDCTQSSEQNRLIMVKTARATADYNGKQTQVRIFIDEGSQRSYIRQEIALTHRDPAS